MWFLRHFVSVIFQFREKSKKTQCNSRPAEINATFGDSFTICGSRTKPIIFFSSQPTLNRRNIVADHAVVLILFAHIRSWCYHWPLFYVTSFYCLQVWKFVLWLYSFCRDVFRLGTLRFVIVETTFMDLKKKEIKLSFIFINFEKKRKLSLKSHEVSNLLGVGTLSSNSSLESRTIRLVGFLLPFVGIR